MLTLVQPGDGHRPAVPPPGCSRASLFSLTADEARHLRAATRNIARVRYGTSSKLADALGVDPSILTRKRAPTPGLAVALWRLTGTPVEELLSAKLAAAPSPGGAS